VREVYGDAHGCRCRRKEEDDEYKVKRGDMGKAESGRDTIGDGTKSGTAIAMAEAAASKTNSWRRPSAH